MLNLALVRFTDDIPQELCVPRVDEPVKSALLEDGHLTLDQIIRLDLPQAEFAFLSACQTMA
ncbi:hypothetical protein CPB86DRAFT_792094 [Serendipita vermifera]|nr:hypothetical protein CPB86DRAFT_792094 [Serendipita vermifera]